MNCLGLNKAPGLAVISKLAIVIPAYRPDDQLIKLVEQLLDKSAHCKKMDAIIIVDDGSGSAFSSVFEVLRQMEGVTVIANATNLGKGAALKHGINHVLSELPDVAGIVTADADGQHHLADICKIMETLRSNPDSFCLGCRAFDRKTPLRSRFGNSISRLVYRLFLGVYLGDTQTGLRGLPSRFARQCLSIPSNRYEFETEQLIIAAKSKMAIVEIPIATIYVDGNRASHFDPLRDSLRIYFVVLRYSVSSVLTAFVDIAVFLLISGFSGNIVFSNLASRTVALGFQFAMLRSFVFRSSGGVIKFALFVAYVMFTGLISGLLQIALSDATGIGPVASKVVVEVSMFFFNMFFLKSTLFSGRS